LNLSVPTATNRYPYPPPVTAPLGMGEHRYEAMVRWTGNLGSGTSSAHGYARDHVIQFQGKPDLMGSSDPEFRGDRSRYNPEELLVASLSACHMLWYLHLSAVRGIVVSDYFDEARGIMQTEADGSGRFVRVTLRPQVTLTQGNETTARELHDEAHRMCFIAHSVNFPVEHQPTIQRAVRAGESSP
jgi:organic hydroperoxide reductase OsmC/OhrA